MFRKLLVASLFALLLGGAAFAQNYTATQGVGTTFGSKLVSTVNYPQIVFCDPTTPSQCVAVNSSGQMSVSAVGIAINSTTSGQTGSLVMGAVTTSPPTYTTAQTDPLSLATSGGLRVDVNSVAGVAVASGNGVPVAGDYFTNVASSTLTRPADTTAYVANETVCASKSSTCTPITISIGSINAGQGLITRVTLLKSGTTTTNASFTIWLYSAAPTLTTPTQEDATAYIGPRAADMPNYIGNAVCGTGIATSDTTTQVWYDCTLSNPNTSGALTFQALSGSTNINALISVTAAYTPVSAETFKIYASGIY